MINEATNPATTPKTELNKLQRKVLLQRAYIAHGRYNLVLSEISDSDPVELRACRLLAKYLAAGPSRSGVAGEAAELLQEMTGHNVAGLVPLATVFYHEGLLDDALRLVVKAPKNLECIAMAVQIYLQLDRVDLARKEVKLFKAWADDATLAQLIESLVDVYTGGEEKYQEAFYIFEEIATNNAATSKLLTGKAVARMHVRKFDEAEAALLEALNKNPNDPDTLANMVVVSTALQKQQSAILQHYSQLVDVAPSHPLVQELQLKDSLFDRCASRYLQ